jgi:integrative and conjugative element protein (TIGR02256 family)
MPPTEDGRLVVITDAALETLLSFRQMRPRDTEAGGQLFARFEGDEVVIVEATPPTRLDYRTRFSFRPNRPLQRRAIAERHRSGLHFVGDWHTHPEARPTPSREDLLGMQECFRLSTHDLSAFLMVIVGTQPPPQGWYVALVDATGEKPLTYHLEERQLQAAATAGPA